MGGVQSNHCRQTAAAAARCGLRCVVVLRGHAPAAANGNLLLDHLLGARVVFSGDRTREDAAEDAVKEERAAGHRPFLIPLGASDAIGSVGFVAALEELDGQVKARGLRPDRVVFGSSSFGTQAGLCVGAKAIGFPGRISAIAIDSRRAELQAGVVTVAASIARRLGLTLALLPDEVVAHDGYLGGGYAVMGPSEREAIRLVAQTEGILLDPVYTGRAMAGLIDLVRRREFGKDETVIFWHTGGSAALFAYADQLLEGDSR
jgi:D-cysteine desulfhydrase